MPTQVSLAGFQNSFDSNFLSNIPPVQADKNLMPGAKFTYLLLTMSSTVSIPKAFFKSFASNSLVPLIAATGAFADSQMLFVS